MGKFIVTELEREAIRGLYEQTAQKQNPLGNLFNEIITNMSKGINIFKPLNVKNTIIVADPTVEFKGDTGSSVGTHTFRFLEYVFNGKTIAQYGVDVLLNGGQIKTDIDPKNLLLLINSKQVSIDRINEPTPYFNQTYPNVFDTLVRTYKLQPQQVLQLFESAMSGSSQVLMSQLPSAQYEANTPEEKARWDKYMALLKQ